MKLKRKYGEGIQGMDVTLTTLEQQQIAEWVKTLEELSDPSCRIEVKLNGDEHADKNFKGTAEDIQARSQRLDDMLVDTINPVSGVTAFLKNLADGVPAPTDVLNDLTKPSTLKH